MKTDNELIAEFMGYVPRTDLHTKGFTMMSLPSSGFAYIDKSKDLHDEFLHLDYDTSWDWLIPVVEKINRIYSRCPSLEEYFERFQLVEDAVTNEWGILEAHAAVVDFIKWFNSHSPNKQ